MQASSRKKPQAATRDGRWPLLPGRLRPQRREILRLLLGVVAIGMELELFGSGARSGRDLLRQLVHLGVDDRAEEPERAPVRSGIQ